MFSSCICLFVLFVFCCIDYNGVVVGVVNFQYYFRVQVLGLSLGQGYFSFILYLVNKVTQSFILVDVIEVGGNWYVQGGVRLGKEGLGLGLDYLGI